MKRLKIMYKYFVNSDKSVKKRYNDKHNIIRTNPDDYIRATMKYSFTDEYGEEAICKLLTKYIKKCDKISCINIYDKDVKVSRIKYDK